MPFTAARRASAAGRHVEAARLFAEADLALGGFPYDESADQYDEDGVWIHAATRSPIRAAMQCAWALSALAAGAEVADTTHGVNTLDMATQRARTSCGPREQAIAAALPRSADRSARFRR